MDLPAQASTNSKLIANMKTVKTLGLEVPSTLLSRAGETHRMDSTVCNESPTGSARSALRAGRSYETNRRISRGERSLARPVISQSPRSDRLAILALTLYALLPVIRNTYTGIRGVDPAVVEAGRGMGLTARQLLFQVELPLALSVILSGVRVAVVVSVGLATIAAAIGAEADRYRRDGLQVSFARSTHRRPLRR